MHHVLLFGANSDCLHVVLTEAWSPLRSRSPLWAPPRSGGFGNQTPNPYNQGGQTPGWGQTGRTPNPYNDNRTPAWTASSKTPNPYADHGKTPAWDATARTPNPYANGGGSSTWGGATPGRGVNWDAAPTPFAAFTPGAAPTPAPFSMQTPFEYQTPAGGAYPQTPGVMAGGYGSQESQYGESPSPSPSSSTQ